MILCLKWIEYIIPFANRLWYNSPEPSNMSIRVSKDATILHNEWNSRMASNFYSNSYTYYYSAFCLFFQDRPYSSKMNHFWYRTCQNLIWESHVWYVQAEPEPEVDLAIDEIQIWTEKIAPKIGPISDRKFVSRVQWKSPSSIREKDSPVRRKEHRQDHVAIYLDQGYPLGVYIWPSYLTDCFMYCGQSPHSPSLL